MANNDIGDKAETATAQEHKAHDAAIFSTAAGLIYQDRFVLLFLYALLITPTVLLNLLNTADPGLLSGLKFSERLLQLLFAIYLGNRVLRNMSHSKDRLKGPGPIYVVLFGLLIWALRVAALPALATLSQTTGGFFIFLICATPAAVCAYVYFLYPFSFLIRASSLKESLLFTASFVKADKFLPLKISIAPLGMMLLAQALLAIPYPDMRLAPLSYASDALGGIFWLLSTYLTIACCLVLMPEKIWSDNKLDPYRQSRLATLEVLAPRYLANAFKPFNGTQFAGLAFILIFANMLRLGTLPPGPEIKVEAARARPVSEAINDGTIPVPLLQADLPPNSTLVAVELEAEDPAYHFRGFQPVQFRLAGEKGERAVSGPPLQVTAGTGSDDVRIFFPRSGEKVRLTAKFIIADMSAEDLSRLEDLHLWYTGTRVSKLQVTAAR